jgi:hypothetical protein
MAKITVALMKELEKQVMKGEISYSRMIEMLNDHKNDHIYEKTSFYKISNYKTRYFKCKPNSPTVVQVCLGVDDLSEKERKSVDIYHITGATFYTNTTLKRHLIPCEENEFNEAFEKAVNILKQ